jgi:ubiquinone/menaquinone biosynthesis C-methylase UbiE
MRTPTKSQNQPLEKRYNPLQELFFIPFEGLTKITEELIKRVEGGTPGEEISEQDYDERSSEEMHSLHLNETKDWILADYVKTLLPSRSSNDLEILDHMAGTGRMSEILKKKFPGAKITAADYSEQSLEVAKKRVADSSYKTVKCSVLEMPFADESFDLILCADGMEHVFMREHAQCIKEAYRCLKKDGVFLFYTPNLCRLLMELFIQKAKHTLKGKPYGYQKGNSGDDHQDTKLHIGLGTTIHYLRLMRKAGFREPREVVFANEYNIPGLSKHLKSQSFLSPFFTKHITIYGRK